MSPSRSRSFWPTTTQWCEVLCGACSGAIFARHRIDALLGRGGMGVVYRATDVFLDRPVALKLIASPLAADPLFRSRFERECRLAARIDHPHVVEIFHAGEEDGALDEAHGLGLVHRDVKPANVLIEDRHGKEHAFLTDFGLTKAVAEESVTRTALPLGTVDYIAPEQATGAEPDARADIYALGCLLFHILTGNVPFPRENDLAKLWSHVHEPSPKLRTLRPDLPGALEQVIERSMAKVPGERQQSAGELARAAGAAIG